MRPEPEDVLLPSVASGETPTDLFGWLDALYTKTHPKGIPPIYMMHRFLAADRLFATVARTLQADVRDSDITFRIWQGLLPRGKGAPRLAYTAVKRPPAAAAVVTGMMRVTGYRREVVEDMVHLLTKQQKLPDLYECFGIDPESGAADGDGVS